MYCNYKSLVEGLTPVYSIAGSTSPSAWGPVPTSSDATWDAVTVDSDANGFRLPTVAEWKWAAKGGTAQKTYAYSGSDTIGDVAWYGGNAGYKSHPVKGKTANSLGIYDMSGNVNEWCWDASGSNRVFYGGEFSTTTENYIKIDSSNGSSYPGNRSTTHGFRIVFPVPAE